MTEVVNGRARLGSCLCGALLLLAPVRAAALSRLVYSRSAEAEQCPNEDALRGAVHARLGYDAFSPWGERTILVEIVEKAGQLSARLALLDEQGWVSGSRQLSSASGDCAELVASLALAISIALDPMMPAAKPDAAQPPSAQAADAAAGDHESRGEATAPEASIAAPERLSGVAANDGKDRPAQPQRSDRQHAQRLQGFGRLGPWLAVGLAPSTAVGGKVGLGFQYAWFRLSADASATLPASIDSELGGTANVSLVSGSLSPCWVRGWAAACALFSLGRTSNHATGVENPRTRHALFAALGARISATASLTPALRVALELEGARTLTPVQLYLHEQNVWSSPALSGVLGVMGEVVFP